MKQAGYEAPTDLRRVPIGEIRADEIDKWTDALMDGGLESALCRVIVEFVPTEQDVASVIEAEGPLFGNLKVQTVAEGQIVSEVGGASDDPEGRAVLGIEHSIKGVAPVLRAAIGKLCERYGLNPEATLSLLRASPLFDTAQIGLVCDGIEAYFGGDHVKAIHVLVPQIERSLRNLLGLLGQPTNKNVRGQVGVMEEKSLNVVLDDRAMQAYLPNDVWAYLSAFLTDVRGMNVRNRIAHGLFNKEDCGQYLSDRVIHVLLLLAMIRHPSGAVAEDH